MWWNNPAISVTNVTFYYYNKTYNIHKTCKVIGDHIMVSFKDWVEVV